MVSLRLRNISQIGSFPQVLVGVKIKSHWNHYLVKCSFEKINTLMYFDVYMLPSYWYKTSKSIADISDEISFPSLSQTKKWLFAIIYVVSQSCRIHTNQYQLATIKLKDAICLWYPGTYVNLHYINAFSLVKNQSLMKPTLPPTAHKTAVTQPS